MAFKRRVSVESGSTLTIPAGTIIKAASGTGADASTLIMPGGKIIANGTADAPIIMTSVSDNIEVGGTYPSSGPALVLLPEVYGEDANIGECSMLFFWRRY